MEFTINEESEFEFAVFDINKLGSRQCVESFVGLMNIEKIMPKSDKWSMAI